MANVTRVYSAQNSLMVDHLKHVLDAQGIGCVVRNRFVAGAAGRLPPNECWLELWIVDDAQLPAARKLLRQAFEEEDPAIGESWECPRCGEELEPQFEACWKCSTSRNADPDDDITTAASPVAPTKKQLAFSQEVNFWLVLALMAIAAWWVARSSRSGW